MVVGDGHSPAAHALAHAINHHLENVGRTVEFREPVEIEPVDETASLSALTQALAAGEVRILLILGGNPVYDAPGELGFAGALARALGIGGASVGIRAGSQSTAPLELCVHLGQYADETSRLAHWHIPAAHYLESWGDVRAFDGTAAILQPLIAPLYGGKTAHEMLSLLMGRPGQGAYDTVQDHWRGQFGAEAFAAQWQRMVHDGLLADSQAPLREPTLQWKDRPEPRHSTFSHASASEHPATDKRGRVEVVFLADPSAVDGRFANNAWLQELPRPLTKLVWDNAALASPQTCERHGLQNGDLIELEFGAGRIVTAPVWLLPGQADDCIALTLGYGRTHSGRVGTGVGYDAYPGLPADGVRWVADVPIRKTGGHHHLVATHGHWSMEGRDLVHTARAADLAAERTTSAAHSPPVARSAPAGGQPDSTELITLYPQDFTYPADMNKWGMVIDQTGCIGCNACIVACQAENNIPTVGREQCDRGREMHWLRVDRYHRGPLENPETFFQPVPCMQCEDAPCELVCPVGATLHDAEGLNNMVYNRCVGTRYCSNNCPYKVRRFNFLNFTGIVEPTLKLLQNPEVTVRSRGVMEKCSYCVQRIDATRIQAKKENRPIHDGELLTACQATCPTRAITFGNLNDPSSAVARLQSSPLRYALLEELGTRPRTTYLAHVTNPHPDLARGQLADAPVPGSQPTGEQTEAAAAAHEAEAAAVGPTPSQPERLPSEALP